MNSKASREEPAWSYDVTFHTCGVRHNFLHSFPPFFMRNKTVFKKGPRDLIPF